MANFGGDPTAFKKAILVASTGGHLAQLVRLAPGLGASDDSLWITFKTPQSESLLKGRRVQYVPYIRPRDLLGTLRALRVIFSCLRRERFDMAVSTGAALAVAALPMAKILGVPTLYIESVSRVQGPSLSGRIIAATRSASLRTQHRSWADKRWHIHPGVLSTFQKIEKDPAKNPKLFVTLGTIEGYRFDALVDKVLESGLANADTVWQLGFTTGRVGLPGRVFQEVAAADFEKYALAADVVVSHSGVGTLLNLLEMGIYPVLVTRRKSRNEHVDDHQIQIAGLAEQMDIASYLEVTELGGASIREAAKFSIAKAVKDSIVPSP